MKELEVPHTIFNPVCKEKILPEEVQNRFSNYTFSLENASTSEEEKKKEASPNKDGKTPAPKKPVRQPGFPLIIELKSRKSKNRLKKPRLNMMNMPYKPKIDGVAHGNLSPVYSNMHGKVIYVMSAKLVKHVTICFPNALLTKTEEEYEHPNVESDITVEVKDQVIHHKKKVKPNTDCAGIYDKEYNTTSEFRRIKNMEVDNSEDQDDTPQKELKDNHDEPEQNGHKVQEIDTKPEQPENNHKTQTNADIEMKDAEEFKNNSQETSKGEKSQETPLKDPNTEKEEVPAKPEDTNSKSDSPKDIKDESAVEEKPAESTENLVDEKLNGVETKNDSLNNDKQNEEEEETDEEYSGEG